MPSMQDLVSFAELVQLGREQADQEWKRRGGELAACAGAELLGAGLSHTERSCLRYGYRERLHTLNCRAELARMQPPATCIVLPLERPPLAAAAAAAPAAAAPRGRS